MEPKENVGKIFFQKLKKIKSRKIDFWARKFFSRLEKFFFHGQKNFFRGRKNFFFEAGKIFFMARKIFFELKINFLGGSKIWIFCFHLFPLQNRLFWKNFVKESGEPKENVGKIFFKKGSKNGHFLASFLKIFFLVKTVKDCLFLKIFSGEARKESPKPGEA